MVMLAGKQRCSVAVMGWWPIPTCVAQGGSLHDQAIPQPLLGVPQFKPVLTPSA